jgi:hypothetical protein
VIYQVAHRYGDEMLLWDDWGATDVEVTSPGLTSSQVCWSEPTPATTRLRVI